MNSSMNGMGFDWNPLHSALFTGAGMFNGPVDSRPAWAVNIPSINLDPRFSDVFKNTIAPVLEVAAIAALDITSLGVLGTVAGHNFQQFNESMGIANPLGMNLDSTFSNVFKDAYVPALKAGGMAAVTFFSGGLGLLAPIAIAGAAIGENYIQEHLGVQNGEGDFAKYAQVIGTLAGGLLKISDSNAPDSQKLKEAAGVAAPVVQAFTAKPKSQPSAPAGSLPSVGVNSYAEIAAQPSAPLTKRSKTFLALGLAFLAYEL